MSVLEGCRKQKKKQRTTPPELQPTVDHNPLAKTVPKHGRPCLLHANLTERLRNIDITEYDARVRTDTPTRVQNTADDITQHSSQLRRWSLLEIGVGADAVRMRGHRKRQVVNDPSF